MTVRVSRAVQAHPDRWELAHTLADRIDADVVFDPNPDDGLKPWRTFRHLLETTPDTATHRFQIQDDATPCAGLAAAVDAAVAAQPDRLIIFFVGGHPAQNARQVLDACAHDRPFATLSHQAFVPCVSTCWPRALIADLLEFVEAQKWPRAFAADDEIVGRWARARRVWPLASVPSLVEHHDLVASVIRRRQMNGLDPGRRAACWIGDCAGCVEEIDWTVEPAPLGPLPIRRR